MLLLTEVRFKCADNLLLTANRKNVKLVDFGLAREETVTEMMTAETGTYRWMAPEVLHYQLASHSFFHFPVSLFSTRATISILKMWTYNKHYLYYII